MRKVVETMVRLSQDPCFTRFQNATAQLMYDALSSGYSDKCSEVDMVSRLVTAINGHSYKKVCLLANKIHGNRSLVSFNFRSTPAKKELGDMVIISVVTAEKKRLFQRISIIQNKKASGNGLSKSKWDIDDKQLFLLKNFPPITGEQGILSGSANLSMRNNSLCLGAYGLFHEPGDMVFISAPLVADILRGKKRLAMTDISAFPVIPGERAGLGTLPWWVPPEYVESDRLYCWLIALGLSDIPFLAYGSQFLGNTFLARDIYDFARAWTQLSLGEVTYAWNAVVNKEADSLASALMKAAGFGDIFVAEDNEPSDEMLKGGLVVAVMHLDVGDLAD